MKTKGTRLTWETLSEWVETYHIINGRGARSRFYAQRYEHLVQLEAHIDTVIWPCNCAESLEKASAIVKANQPVKGSRAEHFTTDLLVEINNQLQHHIKQEV